MMNMLKKIFLVDQNKGTRFVVSPFFDFLMLFVCAAFASALAIFVFSFFIFNAGRGQVTDASLVIMSFAAFMGPAIAWPFLTFFVFPWIEYLKIKDFNHFSLWVLPPTICGLIYAYYSEDYFGKMFTKDGYIMLYGLSAFLTGSFMWLVNQSPPFRNSNPIEVTDNE